MRVVLDTNVVVSAILFEHGSLASLRPLWQTGRFTPLADRACVDELLRVLTYPKFALEPHDIEALIEDYVPFAEVVRHVSRSRSSLPLCRDPQDQKFLVLAFAGRAEVLVSGDRALLELSGKTEFEIETPARFRARFW